MGYEEDWERAERTKKLFEKFEDWADEHPFEDMKEDMKYKPHETSQISAILFLYGKLRKDRRPQAYFLHGEHDVLYIGNMSDFDEFTEDDVKTCLSLGIYIDDESDGFQIYASM